MTRYLAWSAGLHAFLISFFLFASFISARPPHYYVIDFMGAAGGAGGSSGGAPMIAKPGPAAKKFSPPSKTLKEEAPLTAKDKKNRLLLKKKEAAKKQIKTPAKTLSTEPVKEHLRAPTPADFVNKKTGVEGGTGEGGTANLVIGGTGTGGGVGAGGGKGIGGGGIGFGTRFPYTWYINILYQKLWRAWDSRDAGNKECLMAFTILRTGDVDNIKVDQSSGDGLFDQLASRAVGNAAPFPPLPEDFPDKDLRVIVKFKLE